jgi:hypothetical protein
MGEAGHTRESPRGEGAGFLALLLLCALIAAAPVWGPGIINTRGGGDSPFLLARTLDMANSLRHGIFPVRWMAHAAYDLGYPFFNHYAALPFYLSGALTALGVDILIALQVTQTLGFVLAALAMNLWLRPLWPGKAARLLATVAYTFAPFHMVNVYVRGDSLSEFYAFAIYPLILWALDRVAAAVSETCGPDSASAKARRVFGAVTVAALAYGALALTHNVSFVLFSPFALLYGLSAIWHRARASMQDAPGPKPAATDVATTDVATTDVATTHVAATHVATAPLAALAASFAGGILLTTWFWLPALVETRYGQMGPAFTEGYFHFSNHFRGLNLIQPTLAFDYTIATAVSAAGPFSMGLIQAILALAGTAVLAAQLIRTRFRHERSLPHVTLLVALGIATLMITPASRPLWKHVPLLATTQFPWRFLSVQALFASAVTAALAEPGLRRNNHAAPWITAAATVLVMGSALLALRPERLLIRAEDVSRETLLLYESFTGNIGTTIRYEYLPRDVVPRLYISEVVIDGRGSLLVDGGDALEARLISRTPIRQVWTVTLPPPDSDRMTTPISIAFPINAWPGWHAFVDGVQLPTYPTIGSGRLTLDLPRNLGQGGTSTIMLKLLPTPLERGAVVISAGTLFVGLSVLGAGVWRDRWTQPRRKPHKRLATANLTRVMGGAALVPGVLLLAAVGPLISSLLRPSTHTNAPFFDFVQMPFPHQGPVDFGPARLVRATTSGPGAPAHSGSLEAYPGQTLHVSLDWSQLPAEPLTATLRLVSPAVPRHGVELALAETQATVSPHTRIALSLPEDLARGLYLLQLQVNNEEDRQVPQTRGGNSMGDLYIGAIRVTEGPPLPIDAPVMARFRDLTLHDLVVEQVQSTTLHVKMAWSTEGTPRNWQLSIRVLDLEGNQIVANDHQPGYGYLPTTLWRPGEWITDHAVLPLPTGLAPGEYVLHIVTYLLGTMEGGGELHTGIHLDIPTRYDLRDACCELTRKGATLICKTEQIALLRLDLPASISEGEALPIHAEWYALSGSITGPEMPADLEATWRFVAEDGFTLSETTRPPAAGTRTSLWPRHTWVKSAYHLDMPARMDAGSYSLELTLDEQGAAPVACGSVGTVIVRSRVRSFAIPEPPHSQPASFGTSLLLLGYDVEMDRPAGRLFTRAMPDHLMVTFWWQAHSAPDRDYKRFVHLYNPTTEALVAQDDAMPVNWTYPTSWWVSQEVISETVTLDLTGIEPGSYRLAVGWYDPETLERLPATAVPDAALRDNRLTLDLPITLP